MRYLFVGVVLLLALACSRENVPYKFVSDTKPVAPVTRPTGVAVNPLPPTPVLPLSKQSITWDCRDSDFGDITTARGIVNGKSPDGSTFTFEDECFGGILLENNCVNGTPESRKVRCVRGCQNGFCI